jgi:hypothetical protein
MSYIKSASFKLLFSIAILFGAQSAFAGFFNWQTTVHAIEITITGPIPHSTGVSGPTFLACENKRGLVMQDYVNQGFFITSAPHCTLVPFKIPELIKWERIKWPWPGPGPQCLSCPYMLEDIISVVYPENVKQVNDLIQRYNIDLYNEQLMQLQQKFDLEGFEQEMYRMELEQQVKNSEEMLAR